MNRIIKWMHFWHIKMDIHEVLSIKKLIKNNMKKNNNEC